MLVQTKKERKIGSKLSRMEQAKLEVIRVIVESFQQHFAGIFSYTKPTDELLIIA